MVRGPRAIIRHDPRTLLESELGGAHGLAALADGQGQGGTPEDALDARQQTTLLHRAIRALPDEQREALVLQQFSGLALDEIAALCGVPLETVKSRLRYAMRKLRASLASFRWVAWTALLSVAMYIYGF